MLGPANLTPVQLDAIEGDMAILHACIEGAITRLNESGSPRMAAGLQCARHNLEKALGVAPGCPRGPKAGAN